MTNRGTGLDWTVQQDVDGTGLYSKTSTGMKQLENFRDFKQRLKLSLKAHPF